MKSIIIYIVLCLGVGVIGYTQCDPTANDFYAGIELGFMIMFGVFMKKIVKE